MCFSEVTNWNLLYYTQVAAFYLVISASKQGGPPFPLSAEISQKIGHGRGKLYVAQNSSQEYLDHPKFVFSFRRNRYELFSYPSYIP
jgi:hypothetical protein